MTANPRMGSAEWMLLLILSFLWGGVYVFGKVALSEIPPMTLALYRVVPAAAVLWLAVLASGRALPGKPRIWAGFLVMGLINNAIPFTLIFWAQTQIEAGLAAILNAAAPVFSVLLANLLSSDERTSRGRLAGAVLGLLGVALVVGPTPGSLPRAPLHELAALAAALSYALAGIFARSWFVGVPPLQVAAGQLSASSLILAPAVLLGGALPVPSGLPVAGAVAGLALFGTALAYAIYFRIIARAGATNALLVTMLIPVNAIVLGGVILGESLAAHHLVGLGVLALGLAVIDGRPWGVMMRRLGRSR